VQARLRSLGFYGGEIDGAEGEATREAMRTFQRHHGLDVTGESDESTRAKLLQEFGG
jgi:N-acetylmuramoyl-L-alanine amidase